MLGVYVYICMCVLTSIFMQADMHQYIGIDVLCAAYFLSFHLCLLMLLAASTFI